MLRNEHNTTLVTKIQLLSEDKEKLCRKIANNTKNGVHWKI